MQHAITITAFSLDYRRNSRFKLLAPSASGTANGSRHLDLRGNTLSTSPDDVQFRIDFVVEAAIKLLGFDHGVSLGS